MRDCTDYAWQRGTPAPIIGSGVSLTQRALDEAQFRDIMPHTCAPPMPAHEGRDHHRLHV
jgi:hypothetical protein